MDHKELGCYTFEVPLKYVAEHIGNDWFELKKKLKIEKDSTLGRDCAWLMLTKWYDKNKDQETVKIESLCTALKAGNWDELAALFCSQETYISGDSTKFKDAFIKVAQILKNGWEDFARGQLSMTQDDIDEILNSVKDGNRILCMLQVWHNSGVDVIKVLTTKLKKIGCKHIVDELEYMSTVLTDEQRIQIATSICDEWLNLGYQLLPYNEVAKLSGSLNGGPEHTGTKVLTKWRYMNPTMSLVQVKCELCKVLEELKRRDLIKLVRAAPMQEEKDLGPVFSKISKQIGSGCEELTIYLGMSTDDYKTCRDSVAYHREPWKTMLELWQNNTAYYQRPILAKAFRYLKRNDLVMKLGFTKDDDLRTEPPRPPPRPSADTTDLTNSVQNLTMDSPRACEVSMIRQASLDLDDTMHIPRTRGGPMQDSQDPDRRGPPTTVLDSMYMMSLPGQGPSYTTTDEPMDILMPREVPMRAQGREVAQTDSFSEKSEIYSMKGDIRVIILNLGGTGRPGSATDIDSVEKLLQKFGPVCIHDHRLNNKKTAENLKKRILKMLEEEAKNAKKHRALMMFVMGHGNNKDDIYVGNDFEVNKVTLNIETDILPRFTFDKSEGYKGKPKMFFFQACRGDDVYGCEKAQTDSVKDSPALEDILKVYSCTKTNMATRFTSKGSPFIQDLVSVFRKSYTSCDVMEMVTKAQCKTRRRGAIETEEGKTKQLPIFESTLLKKVYLV